MSQPHTTSYFVFSSSFRADKWSNSALHLEYARSAFTPFIILSWIGRYSYIKEKRGERGEGGEGEGKKKKEGEKKKKKKEEEERENERE